jgi:DNA mismatch repair protein MutS
MGKRLLRDWLCRPLARLEPIVARQRCVSALVTDRRFSAELGAALTGVQDVARIAARVALGRPSPRDLTALGRSCARVEAIDAALVNVGAFAGHLQRLREVRADLEPLAAAIGAACVDDPPAHLRDGGLVRDGFDAGLDEARLLERDAGAWLAEYQKTLIETHQLPSLKVGYNRVFGYYIELPKAQAARAPDAFSRRQTLTNAERFVTPELKEFEEKVSNAAAKALEREQAIFDDLCAKAAGLLVPIDHFGQVCAELDALVCLADKAAARRWVAPEVVEAPVLSIVQGRHPVLDETLGNGFVPNDVSLGVAETGAAEGPSLALITGPNMAGKSTFIRQTALLVLLAHAGSFVPAERATVGLTDRVFARVGADDALHAGQSTFMVEMTETANILHHAGPRALVVLDEIGRGTSTLDGLSLAWAITETLAAPQGTAPGAPRGPRTLFATHYHELTALDERLPGRVRNLHVAVREFGEPGQDGQGSQIVFLHRILPGKTDRSYGLHVARLAGIPERTVARARQVLADLSVEHAGIGGVGGAAVSGRSAADRAAAVSNAPAASGAGPAREGQLSLFTEYVPHPAVVELKGLSLDAMTPLEAFDALRRLHGLAGK